MKVKLKDSGNKIPYGSSCMGFDSDIRISLNSGKTIELDSVPEKGAGYIEEVGSTSKKKGDK